MRLGNLIQRKTLTDQRLDLALQHQLEHLVGVPPAEDVGQRVRPGDEVEVGVGQLGARGEFAQTTFSLPLADEEFDSDYNSLFPSMNLSYDLQQGRTVRLNHSRRIGRPYAYILNPSNPSTDPLNRFVGNPHIRPNYTNSIGLDFSKIGSKGTMRFAPYYRKTTDNWDNIRTVDSVGVSTISWAPAGSAMRYSTLGSVRLSRSTK